MNNHAFTFINRLSGRFFPVDWLMILISNKIRYVFGFMLIFMWLRNDSYKKAACHAGISAGIAWVIHTLIKCFYYKPRPFVKQRVGILIPAKNDSTFPSKHTLLSFAVSTTIYFYDRAFGAIMTGLSVLAGFSRIWVGHHYPADIIGSALIGSVMSIIVEKLPINLTRSPIKGDSANNP